MRCPKCQYFGFDGHTRCRHCGYDLSLSSTLDVSPPASPPAASTAPANLPLRAEPSAREQARAAIRQRAAGTAAAPAPESFDLPLFATPGAEDLPVVPAASAARPPLAVRRPLPDPPRPRAAVPPPAPPVEEPRLELDLTRPNPAFDTVPFGLDEVDPAPALGHGESAAPPEATAPAVAVSAPDAGVSLSSRVLAGLVDVALLAALGGAVVASTVRVMELSLAEVWRLPPGPLGAFLALLAVGYLTMCVVLSGQTAGKALVGLQVVECGGRPVRFAPAVIRAVLQVLTVPLLGLGFLPAALAADGRALYNRLANTEVIRTRR